ncbi:unnamed protein product [Closterium sp. NIES-54]
MWIFRVKRPPGSPPVFKARYVARGFSQWQGVDYFQTFSPTPKMTTLRVLLHVAAHRDYELHSLDFSTAFLQGSLHEEIWLRRPPGFTGTFPPGTQWSLRRPVYGLLQAPREWHDTLRTTLAALGFAPSTADPSLFLRTDTSLPPFYILVYLDDLVFAKADTAGLAHVKSELQKRHTCTELGELRSYLGLQITRDRARRTITLTQSHMVQQVLQRFGFTYSSPQATPLSTRHSLSALPLDESVESSGPYPELVGCLMYLMTYTRPDLAYTLSILARYVAPGRHRPEHMVAAKRVLRYLCSTSGMGLVLGGRSPVVLTGHADASWADDQATQRSSQGYTFSLGSGSVSWRATRSSSVLGSSCEAEIYAGAMAAQELRWLTYLLIDLGEPPRSPPVLVSQLMAKSIHLEANSTTQEFKLYHGKGGLYIGKAVLKNNVFVLDFVPDLGTADSDGIVTFTSWTHPPDLDPDFSPEGFWYSHTIPEAERTRALATIQHSAAVETTPPAAETTPAAAETTPAVANTASAAAETTAATSTPLAGTFLLPSLTGPPDCFRCLSSCRAPRARDDFLLAVCSWRTAVFCLPARRAPRGVRRCPARRAPRGVRRCPARRAPRGARRIRRLSRHTGGPRTPPLSFPVACRGDLGGGGRASPPFCRLFQRPGGPCVGAAAPGAAAPGAAAPGPRDAAPGPRDAAPGPHGADLAAACDAVPGPGAAASLCCPLLLSPPFFVSLLHVQPWNRGYGGGGYGGDGWCVSLPLLLLSLPLLQLPLGGGCEGVGEPGEWHWGGGCETSSPRPSEGKHSRSTEAIALQAQLIFHIPDPNHRIRFPTAPPNTVRPSQLLLN